MKLYGCSLLMLCVFSAAVQAGEPEVEQLGDRIDRVTFHSEVLDREMAFCVVLPEGYDEAREDWSVLFMLHGLGRHERTLVEDETTRDALLSAPFVTVLPRGRNCWYIDAPGLSEERYETYTEEVIRLAEQMYRLSKKRDQRAIAGWSAGGYGSARFAERHPDQFAALATIIGLLDFPRDDHPKGSNFKVPLGRFTDDPEVWRRFNPIYGAESLKDMAVMIIAADRATDCLMNENFSAKLTELSIPHEWRLIEGAHTFKSVTAGVLLIVDFMSQQFDQETGADKTSTP